MKYCHMSAAPGLVGFTLDEYEDAQARGEKIVVLGI